MADYGFSINSNDPGVRVKLLKQGVSLEEAKQVLGDDSSGDKTRDGYDTYGVKLSSGRDALVLSQKVFQADKSDKVIVNGEKAQVVFTENEINTAVEGGLATAEGLVLVATGFGFLGQAKPLLAMVNNPGALGAIVVGGTIYGAMVEPDESVTDALTERPETPAPQTAEEPPLAVMPEAKPSAPRGILVDTLPAELLQTNNA